MPELLVNVQLTIAVHVQLSFNGEKCVLILCAWKVAFLKSGHILAKTIITPPKINLDITNKLMPTL